MAAALVLGEWIGQYGLQTGILVSIFMMLAMILLWDGMRVGAVRELLRQKGIRIWGRERYFLPFFCCLGVVLGVRGAAPVEFARCLEGDFREGRKEVQNQGITGRLSGIIEEIEPDGEGIRLYVRECVVWDASFGQGISLEKQWASGKNEAEKGELSKENPIQSPQEGSVYEGKEALSAGRVLIVCAGVDFATEALDYLPGSRIEANGWIYLFPEASNPGQFDTRNYYLGKNVQVGMQADSVIVGTEAASGLQSMVRREILWLEMKLYASLEAICESRDAGVFQAVLLGASRQVEEETKQLYQAGGIAHLLSISGLHISCIAMVMYQAIRRYTGSFPVGLAGGAVFLVGYGMIVGNGASALRAMIMFVCLMGANVTGRKYDLLSAAGLAMILILLWYPMQIYQAGFWMTFLAVAGIGVVYPAVLEFTGCKGRGMNSILFSASVQMSVLPVVLFSSYVCPMYSILLNMLVVPFAAYVLFSAAGGAVGGILLREAGVFLAGTGHYILDWYEWLCSQMQKLPGASVIAGKPELWQIFLYYGALLFGVYLMRYWGRRKKPGESCRESTAEEMSPETKGGLLSRRVIQRKGIQELEELLTKEERRRVYIRKCRNILMVSVGAVLLYGILQKYPDGKLHITMLDVGQGESIHLQLPEGGHMVIDGGSTDVTNPGTYRIEPYLLSQGVNVIDLLIVTHSDADHCNGILELLKRGKVQIKELYLARMWETDAWAEILACAEEQGIPIRYAQAGDGFMLDGVTFACLHPKAVAVEENDNSIVLRLEYGRFSALFTGDISMAGEDFLDRLKPVTLLKVPHHGSRYSASTKLLSACMPKAAFISSGVGNWYGHPHEELLQRLESVGCEWYVTKKSGALFLETDGAFVNCDTFLEAVYFSTGTVYTTEE